MFHTESEIFGQYDALKKSYNYMLENKAKIVSFFREHKFEKLIFTGSGSGYSLCRSAEMTFSMNGINASAVAAGDLLVNFENYKKMLRNSMIITPSRSGSTSEVVSSVKMAKDDLGIKCVSITTVKDSDLSKVSDLCLELPWAFDESVCQTRTVTNLYTVNLLLCAFINDDQLLIDEIKDSIDAGDSFIDNYKDKLLDINNKRDFNKAVVLADAELQGIGDEASIAFKEIPQVVSNYYHVLDVRHGPIVTIDAKTIVIAAVSNNNTDYQNGVIRDIAKKGAYVISIGSAEGMDSDFSVKVPEYSHYSVMGIPFIFICQALALFKAKKKGINPDEPSGLDAWINLEG